jgi:DnaJ like chaperone protein
MLINLIETSMPMWGKLIGGFFGALFAGPLGILFGVLIGHAFDQGLKVPSMFSFGQTGSTHTHAQEVFFDATFLVMGHVAKADGHVSEQEIKAARAVMARLGLSGALKQRAIDLFRLGKQPAFNLQKTLDDLFDACRRNPILLQMFVEIQWQVAQVDGMTANKQHVLQTICQRLGITLYNFSAFEDFFRTGYQQSRQSYQTVSPRNTLSEAYKLLGLTETVSDVEVKKAYRRLMSQNHPDKLIAKGLPEEMVKLATEKTQNIRAAYDAVCKARGI